MLKKPSLVIAWIRNLAEEPGAAETIAEMKQLAKKNWPVIVEGAKAERPAANRRNAN